VLGLYDNRSTARLCVFFFADGGAEVRVQHSIRDHNIINIFKLWCPAVIPQ